MHKFLSYLRIATDIGAISLFFVSAFFRLKDEALIAVIALAIIAMVHIVLYVYESRNNVRMTQLLSDNNQKIKELQDSIERQNDELGQKEKYIQELKKNKRKEIAMKPFLDSYLNLFSLDHRDANFQMDPQTKLSNLMDSVHTSLEVDGASVSLKRIEVYSDEEDVRSKLVENIARDKWSANIRKNIKYSGSVTIEGNTDFEHNVEYVEKNNRGGYFCSHDLRLDYVRLKNYKNARLDLDFIRKGDIIKDMEDPVEQQKLIIKHWPTDMYVSNIVVPVFKRQGQSLILWGFLCVDHPQASAFDEDWHINLLISIAELLSYYVHIIDINIKSSLSGEMPDGNIVTFQPSNDPDLNIKLGS